MPRVIFPPQLRHLAHGLLHEQTGSEGMSSKDLRNRFPRYQSQRRGKDKAELLRFWEEASEGQRKQSFLHGGNEDEPGNDFSRSLCGSGDAGDGG